MSVYQIREGSVRSDRATRDRDLTAVFVVDDRVMDIPANVIGITRFEQLTMIGVEGSGYPLGGNYVLMNDIDASESQTMNGGAGFMPIGGTMRNEEFRGIFDGRGFIIVGLYINRPNTTDLVGLFMDVTNMVTNVHMVAHTIIGGGRVGAVAGCISGGRISNSSASGKVVGGELAGGLVGFAINPSSAFASITSCYSTGSVSGPSAGGLVGRGVYLAMSYSTADVIGGAGGSAGGIAYNITGSNSNYFPRQIFATGNVTGGNRGVGGLLGSTWGNVTLRQGYSIGKVVGINNVGGLIGESSSIDRHSSSYWDITTSGQTTSAGVGVVGKETHEMKEFVTYIDWDFQNTWIIHPDLNDGYPFLRVFTSDFLRLAKRPEQQSSSRTTVNAAIPKPQISLRGKILTVSSPTENSNLQIRLYDLRGKTVARLTSSTELARFPLVNLSSGRYLVEVRDINRNTKTVSPIMLR